MSIRGKILLVIISVGVFTTGLVLLSNSILFSRFARVTIDDELKTAILKINESIDMIEAYTHSTAMFFAHDSSLVSYVEKRNRVLTTNRSMQLLRMLERTGVESLTIINSEGIVLSRAHTLATYGDNVSHVPAVQRALKGVETVGAQSLELNDLSIHATVPMYNENDEIIGVLIAGIQLDTDKFVDNIKALTGCEISVFKDDIRIATTLVYGSGVRAVGDFSENRLNKVINTGFDEMMEFRFYDAIYLTRHLPITDNDGNIIGLISAGRYLTDLESTIGSFIYTGIVISIIVLTITILIVLRITKVISAEADDSIKKINIDSLTGVYNRRYFDGIMEPLINGLSRSDDNWLTIMMVDIDYFKRFNDTYGHLKGDECIKAVADILSKSIGRQNDFVARYGGEEFAVVLPNTNNTGAKIIASLILEGVQNEKIPHRASDVADHVTVSIGVMSDKVVHTVKAKDYINAADIALYKAKENGRNQIQFVE